VTLPENVDAIHSMIPGDRRISAKNIAWILAIGYIIHEMLNMRKLSVKWVPKYLHARQKPDRVLAIQAILDRLRRDSVRYLIVS
jgi:hypothetical protein